MSSLFTKEFFESARDRLAPGGIICQWANAYNISEPDLRSIVATFTSVFPERHACGWSVATMCCCSRRNEPIDDAMAALLAKMKRPEVAADLAVRRRRRPVLDPVAVHRRARASLRGYAEGAPMFTDDRMTARVHGAPGAAQARAPARTARR